MEIDFLKHNSISWDEEVKRGSEWTLPATKEQVEESRNGKILVKLTPTKYIPENWLGDIKDKKILCLASGGGQQGPLLAAGGARVSVLDNSKEQLGQDVSVARRENLKIEVYPGDMRKLTMFSDSYFDMIINPVSIPFVEDIQPVWMECIRVLKPGGKLMCGAINPLVYIFDYTDRKTLQLKIRYSIPYSDINSFSDQKKTDFIENKIPFEFGHSMEDIIKGQTDSGFTIHGFYEDNNGGTSELDKYINTYFAILAVKPLINNI